MKGYVYITGTGADPAAKNNFNDPVFEGVPTLGACMPNIRRLVVPGDYIFVVSGMVPGFQQYVVGGLRVAEKISALVAYERFPQNRLRVDETGKVTGNVVTTKDGTKHPLDSHDAATFASRVDNFIVGDQAVSLETPNEVELGRKQSLIKLSQILNKRGNRVIDIVSRWSKLDEGQVGEMVRWLQGIKLSAATP